MPSARATTEQGRERQQQLLDSAARLFADRGYSATRVSDICAGAGVAKGLFYWYFDSKESLFGELARTMRQQLRRAQAAAMAGIDDPVDRLRLGTEASVRFMADHVAFFELLDVERGVQRVDDVARESSAIYLADTERLVAEAQAAGLVPDDADPHLVALGVVSTVGQFGAHHRAGRVSMDVDELARFVGGWILRAIGAGSRTATT